MLNITILSGRITHDLELKQTPSNNAVLSFTVAVERGFSKQGEDKKTDFLNCVAWNKTAEFIYNYFSKGDPIAIRGNLRTRTYEDKNGSKHYVTEVFVDEAQFTLSSKHQQSTQQGYNTAPAAPAETRGVQEWAHVPKNDKPPADVDMSQFDVFSEDGVPF